jgi:hypothetical protein
MQIHSKSLDSESEKVSNNLLLKMTAGSNQKSLMQLRDRAALEKNLYLISSLNVNLQVVVYSKGVV